MPNHSPEQGRDILSSPETNLLTGDPFLEYYTLPISQINPSLHLSPPLPQQPLLQPGDGFEVPDYLESAALPSVINPYEYPSHHWTEVVNDDVLYQGNPQEDGDGFTTEGEDYQDEYDTFPFGSRSRYFFLMQAFDNSNFSASRLPAVILPAAFNEVEEEEVGEEGEGDQQASLEDEEDGWHEVVSWPCVTPWK